jgi:hypothetical protein
MYIIIRQQLGENVKYGWDISEKSFGGGLAGICA